MVGDALFARPVDPSALGTLGIGYRTGTSIYDPAVSVSIATSSWTRLASPPNAQIFGIDRDFDFDLQPDFAYNFAPSATIAWTNWPDFFSPLFPQGPGQPNGAAVSSGGGPIGDGNPYGNPGYGDSRWLASAEPVRGDANGDLVPDTFTHWPHLSFIATPENGYRIVPDISNIVLNTIVNVNEANTATSFALGMPYEQWLTNFVPTQGVPSPAQFFGLRDIWFAPPSASSSYVTNYASINTLPNLYRLADLKASPTAKRR